MKETLTRLDAEWKGWDKPKTSKLKRKLKEAKDTVCALVVLIKLLTE